jgi:DNA polymerase-3 subunit epsilon
MPRRLIGRLAGLLGARQPPPRRHAMPAPPADMPLAHLSFTVFDSETTGLDVRRDRIVSVGGLHLHGARREDSPALDFLIHPGLPIPKTSTAIHGIDDAMVAAAPPLALLWPAIVASWQHRILLGHNIAYDLAILQHEAERHRLPLPPPAGTLDIGLLYAGLRPRQSQITLERIAGDFGVTITGRHTALGDAEACAAIWARLLPALEQHGVATWSAACALTARQRDLLHGQTRAGWAVDWLATS